MTGSLIGMPKKPTKPKGGAKPTRPPSRENTKYAGIPRDYWDLLEAMTADGEKFEGRSVAFLVKLGVRMLLQQEGKVDSKGKPVAAPQPDAD